MPLITRALRPRAATPHAPKRLAMKTGISWLDLKLGIRMLFKNPGLTLVGGLGIAVAIAIGAGSFAFFYSNLWPTLPLEEGDRIVALENWDVRKNNEDRHSIHDFATWRSEMKTMEDIGAFRDVRRNLIGPGGPPEPVVIAEMTASGFRIARVRPLMGRYLVEADERPGAPPVLVIGYDAWRTRFGGDPGIVGREVRLGNTVHTIAGVMPEGFGFPLNHRFWSPLRADPARYERGEGPSLYVFGRLAPGATMGQAQAELATLGRRAAAAYPKTNGHLRPHVLPYTYPLIDIQDVALSEIGMMQLMVNLLLLVVAVNVAILVYARTASRMGEITVRTALGASRGRVVGQLFVEGLVLSAVSAAAGLGIAQLGLRYANGIMEAETGGTPFWADYGLSLPTVLFTMGMALFTAVVVGVIPALQSTGRRLQTGLRELGGATGMRMGTMWTGLIVAQVGFAVAALPVAVAMGWNEMRMAATRPTFPADEYFAAGLAMEREPPAGADAEAYTRTLDARFGQLQAELVRRLHAEPGVRAVTFSISPPGDNGMGSVEVEGRPIPPDAAGKTTRFNRVDPGFFDAFGVRVLTGRGFTAADVDSASSAIVVNRVFVERILGGGNALGRRVRYLADDDDGDMRTQPARWYEIVGVVGDLHENPLEPEVPGPQLYHATSAGQWPLGYVEVRVEGAARGGFPTRLREITATLDPTLRVGEVRSMAELDQQARQVVRLVGLTLASVTLSVLVLSAAGIYALMSFTVAQRRKEIGIRAALGAHPRRLLVSIFARASRQLAFGLVAGAATAALADLAAGGEMLHGRGVVLLPIVACVMLVVGLLAALGPARRGLRIQPSEALKAEG